MADRPVNHEILRARSKPGSKYRARLRRRVFERDDWTCWICGGKVDPSVSPKAKTFPTLDHVLPWSEGGKWTMANLRTAHRGCNNERHNPPRRRRAVAPRDSRLPEEGTDA